jgi:hypothetical protein
VASELHACVGYWINAAEDADVSLIFLGSALTGGVCSNTLR